MSIYQVVVKGCKDGKNINQVADSLAVLFKCNPDQLRPLLISNHFIVKHSLDLETAKKYLKALEEAGCIAAIESELIFDLPSSSQASASENQLSSEDNRALLLKENGTLPTHLRFSKSAATKKIPTSSMDSSEKKQSMSVGRIIFIVLMLNLGMGGILSQCSPTNTTEISNHNINSPQAVIAPNTAELAEEKKAADTNAVEVDKSKDNKMLYDFFIQIPGNYKQGQFESEFIDGQLLNTCMVGGKYRAYYAWFVMKETFVMGMPYDGKPSKFYGFVVDYGNGKHQWVIEDESHIESVKSFMHDQGCG